MEKIFSYKDLIVWQKSVELALEIYKLTSLFPNVEVYGLTSQMRRASVSVASNIAEGSIRGSKKDFCHFLRISLGSIAELQTQLEIAKSLSFVNDLDYNGMNNLTIEISKMIHGLIGKLKT
jgi:four helix bundle protein